MRQPDKVVRHTQTVRRQIPTNCLSVFAHFVGLTFKGLISAFCFPVTFYQGLLLRWTLLPEMFDFI